MRRGVISTSCISSLGHDFGRDDVAHPERSGSDSNAVRAREPGSQAQHSLDGRRGEPARAEDAADVGYLATRFEIEGRALEHHVAGLTGAEGLSRLPPVVEQSHNSNAGHGCARVALELIADL